MHLLCFKVFCVEKLWIYKREPVQVSYGQEKRYSAGDTYGGYSVGSGDGEGVCTADDGLCTGYGCILLIVYMMGIVEDHTEDRVDVMVEHMDNNYMYKEFMMEQTRDVMIKKLVMIKKVVLGNEEPEKILVIETVVVENTLYGISITLAFT